MSQIEKLKANFKAIKASWEINKGGFPLTKERLNIINSFTGWGGCNAVLYPLDKDWSKIGGISKENLKAEKEVKKGYNFLCEIFGEKTAQQMWSSIKKATLTSFYTPQSVPDALFEEIKKQNPQKNISFLDPCSGGGAYIDGCLKYFPEAEITAVEKDGLTAFLLKAKYKDNKNITVYDKGFEEVNFRNNKYDIIASNIPFGDFKVAYPSYEKKITDKIHNFFFHHAQNLLKENGILSFITSTGVFNSKENSIVRENLLKEGEILDFKVLPNDTFEDTAVSSHIVTYLKNNQDNTAKQQIFLGVSEDENGVVLNNFIKENKGKTYFSEPTYGKDQYGKPEYTYNAELEEWISSLKEQWGKIPLLINTKAIKKEDNSLEELFYPIKKVSSLNTKETNIVEELQFIRKKNIPENISNFQVVATLRGQVNAERTIPLITVFTGKINEEKVYYLQSDVEGTNITPVNEQWIKGDGIAKEMQIVFDNIQRISQEHQMAISVDFRKDVVGERFIKFFNENYKHAKLEYGYTKTIDLKYHRDLKPKDIFVTKKGNIAQIEEIEEITPDLDSEFPQKVDSYKVKQIEVPAKDKQKLIDLLYLYSDYNEFIERHFQYRRGVEWSIEQLEEKKEKINLAYDAFSAKYGKINEDKQFLNTYKDLLGDVYPVIRGLETYTEEAINPELPKEGNNVKEVYNKAGIFSYDYKKDFNKEYTTDVALVKSFSVKGDIDIPYIASLTKKEEETILDELAEIIIKNPLNGKYELKESFLKGDMYEKKEAIERLPDSKDKEAALEIIQQYFPEKISFYEIKYQFGSRWIPIEIYKDFIKEQLKANCKVDFNIETDTFLFDIKEHDIDREYYLRKKLSNDRYFTSKDVIKHAFYGTYPEITTSEKYVDKKGNTKKKEIILYKDTAFCKRQIDNFKQQFERYINNLSEEKKAEIVDVYNRKFNYLATNVEVNNSFFKLGINTENLGISKEYPHQVDGVWKMLLNNGGIIDHEVGYGKTISLVALAHNLKKFGKAKLPLILGLPANISEIAKRYQQAYPQDRILYAGKEEFAPENREMFFNQLRNNEYDVVIMSHEQFKAIPISDEIYLQETEKEIKNLELNLLMAKENNLNPKDYKNLEIAIENEKARAIQLKENIESGKNKNIPHIGNLGIDHIIVDESHAFKNGKFTTRHGRVKGIGKTDGSGRAHSLKMAIRSIQKNNDSDFGATFFSGTPISNALSELYILQNYLTPNLLEEKGIANFDAWASTFMLKSQEMESNVVGEAIITERFRKYMNIPELSKMYIDMTHTMRGDSEFVQRPKQDVKMLINNLTPRQKSFNAKLVKLLKEDGAEDVEKELKLEEPLKRDEWNNVKGLALQITNLALDSSLDMRMVNKNFPDDPNSKVNTMIHNALDRYKRYDEMKGTQILFCDRGVSYKKLSYEQMDYNYKNNIFTSLYDDIKYKLMKSGIPENEIAFIQDYHTDRKKMQLSKLMNEGKIRFLIGGIQNAGTGINVQKRLCGVTHFTLPWRPSDLEQGNGRIFRAGNEIARKMNNNRCEITMCATNGTLDNYKVEFLKRKINFINQIREGANSNIRILDEGEMAEDMALDLATLQAELAGDNTILEKAKVDKELEELNKTINDFSIQKNKAQDKLKTALKEREGKEKIISYIERDIKKAQELIQYKGDKKINAPKIEELGEIFNEDTLVVYFKDKIKEIAQKNIGESIKVGELYGFDMVYKRNFNGVSAFLVSQDEPKIQYENNYVDDLWQKSNSDKVIGNSFINCFTTMEKKLKENKKFFEKYDTDVKSAQLELNEILPEETFNKQKELIKKQEELDIKLKETGGLKTKAEYEEIEEIENGRTVIIPKINSDEKELDRAILYGQFGKDGQVASVYIEDEKMLELFQRKFNNNGIILDSEPLFNRERGAYFVKFMIEDTDKWYETFYYEYNPQARISFEEQTSLFVEEEKTPKKQQKTPEEQKKTISEDKIYKKDKYGQLTFAFENLENIPTQNSNIDLSKGNKEVDIVDAKIEAALEIIRNKKVKKEATEYEEGEEIIQNWECPEKYQNFPSLGDTAGINREDKVVQMAFFFPNKKGIIYLNELDKEIGMAYGLYAIGDEGKIEFKEFSLKDLLEEGIQEIDFNKQTYKELVDEELYLEINPSELESLFYGKLCFEQDRWKNLPDEESIIPKIYEQDGIEGKDKLVYKIIYAPKNKGVWFMNEYDSENNEGFGLCHLGYPEWGYFSLDELAGINAQEIVLDPPKTYEELLETELKANLLPEELERVFNGKLSFEKKNQTNEQKENSTAYTKTIGGIDVTVVTPSVDKPIENESYLKVKETNDPYEKTYQAKTSDGKLIDVFSFTKSEIVYKEDGEQEIIPVKVNEVDDTPIEEDWSYSEEEKEEISKGKKNNF